MNEEALNKKYALAQHYEGIQNYQKAIDICFEILSEYPEDINAKYLLASLYYNLDYTDYNNKSLELCYELINSKFSKNIMDLMGNIYFEQGEYLKSKLIYEDLLSKEPNYAKAISGYGKALYGLGQEKEAKIQYEKAMELEPNNYYILSDVYIGFSEFSMNKEYELSLLNKMLGFGQHLFKMYIYFANTYSKYLDYENALEFYKKAIQINPTNKSLIEHIDRLIVAINYSKEKKEKIELIMFHQINGNYNEIINICLEILKTIPSDIYAKYYLAYSYFILGSNLDDYYDKALKIANELVSHLSINDHIGIIVNNKGENISFSYFSRIINLIAKIHFNRKEYIKAKVVYENYLKNKPNDIEGISGYGKTLYALGNKEEGMDNLNKAIELEPENTNTLWEFYFVIHTFSNDKDKEVNLLNNILKLQNNEVEISKVSTSLGYAYTVKSNDKNKEVNLLNNVLQFENNKAETLKVYTFLGHTYTKYNDYKMAIEFFNKALKINPNDEELKECINYAKNSFKETKSLSWLQKILKLLK